MRTMTVKLEPVHAYVVAEALAHALNSGHFKEKDAPDTRGRLSIFAWQNLAQQVLEQIADAGIINREGTTVRARLPRRATTPRR
jgi:hypothetical protein